MNRGVAPEQSNWGETGGEAEAEGEPMPTAFAKKRRQQQAGQKQAAERADTHGCITPDR